MLDLKQQLTELIEAYAVAKGSTDPSWRRC